MKHWHEQLDQVESAALQTQAREEAAERMFDEALARAEAQGSPEQAVASREFADWIAARHDSDAAWGRWALVMDAKPAG